MKIKPCPFCGGEVALRATPLGFEKWLFYVFCPGCGASMFAGKKKDPISAIRHWDQRFGEVMPMDHD